MGTGPQILIFGFLISNLYALVAVGFTMIFGVARVLNLAHGALVLIGGYVAILLYTSGDTNIRLPQGGLEAWLGPELGLPLAILGAVAATTLFAMGLYVFLVRRVQDKPITVFMTTLLVGVIVEEFISWSFSSNARGLNLEGFVTSILDNFEVVRELGLEQGVPFFGIILTHTRIFASLATLVVMAALWYFVNRTRTGKAIMATSMDAMGSALVGVNARRIQLITWAISGVFAALSGIFLASFLGTSPIGGRLPLVIAFTIVVLGGLGSIQGSLLAAYLVGYTETITTQLMSPTYRGFPSLIILVLVLLWRPQGLMGKE